MTTRYFHIGQIIIKVNMPEELAPPENFLLFETSERKSEYEYAIELYSIYIYFKYSAKVFIL